MEETITVKELQEKLNKREKVFILDVRPADQRKEWKIGDSVHVDAYKKLNAGDETALDIVELPPNSTVVTVCAAGRTSLLASKLLHRKGLHAYSLKGGMKAWNYAWNTAELLFDNFKVIQIRRAAKGVLSYIVGSKDEAVVIDAALDPQVYIDSAKENNWKIKYVADTHVHADYVSRTRDLAIKSGAKHLLIDKAGVDFDFTPIKPSELMSFGNTQLQFIHTPGHTCESTTFKVGDEALFTGDTLFVDSIGRPDLKAEREEAVQKTKTLYQSLNLLLRLPPTMMVLPAHTSNSVSFDDKIVGDTLEKVSGRITKILSSETSFVDYTLSRIPPTPPNYLTIASINKKGSYDGQELADLEAGGNHCAIA
jgi:glyoxylase-like metal-dependent hydrolase (beta-lactamase superfamily II)/rhodanese-related sulfurtransferase